MAARSGVLASGAIIKQNELEILLSGLSGFQKPRPELEQWSTPGDVAAKMVLLAIGDVEGKIVCDLGAGTGILSAACALAGAERVLSVEADSGACETMRRNFKSLGISGEIHNCDVSDFCEPADTVLMNPPFGAQRAARHLDRVFLAKAFSLAPVVYSLHLAGTRNFIRGFSESVGFRDSVLGTFRFPLPASFEFHKKPRKTVEVDYHRIWR